MAGQDLDRRRALRLMGGAAAASLSGCTVRPSDGRVPRQQRGASVATPASDPDAVLAVTALGPRWETSDPFLFCAHHDDRYPPGNAQMGPAASLAGHRMGSDFDHPDGWNMYHGEVVPGFPRHPHRGFETISVVRSGLLDHSDSLGARARYGEGDVQWMTAGRGILHAEMFPLLDQARPNRLEMFQVWLNLPAVRKMVQPAFSMLWNDTIPQVVERDAQGHATTVTMVAGAYGGKQPPAPPADSYAAQADADVAIWTIELEPEAQWTLPAARVGTERSLYFFEGTGLVVAGRPIPDYHRVQVRGDAAVTVAASGGPVEALLLQGRPLREPIARHGPFVMNTQDEIRQAYADYRATGFGGWPWSGDDPVHGREQRFAQHADGRHDKPA